MKKYILGFAIAMAASAGFAQTTFKSEKYKLSISYDDAWEVNKKATDERNVISLMYSAAITNKPKLAVAFSIVAEDAKFDGNLDKMSFAYERKLMKRREMTNTEILSEEIIEIGGKKVIQMTGAAHIPFVKQNSNWNIYLFEHAGYYFEVGLTASKKNFKNKKVKDDYNKLFDSLKLN